MSLKPKQVDFSATWGILKSTVKGVVTLKKVPRSDWNDRFSDVYSLCVAYPEPLAEKLYQETKKFLEEHVQSLLDNVQASNHEQYLTTYYKLWQDYSQGMDYLHKLYRYLNTSHIKKQKISEAEMIYGPITYDMQEQMKEIGELGLDLWKKHMIEPLRTMLVSLLLDAIHADRTGETLYNENSSIIHGVIQSFVSVEEFKKKNALELYTQVFEEPFLQATGEYYRQEASGMLQELSISLYMEKVLQLRDEEDLRCRKYTHPSSYTKVRSELEKRMVADHLTTLHNECPLMVQEEREQDLRNAHALLKAVPNGLSVLVSKMTEHIKQQGLQTVTNLSGDNMASQFVEGMLAVHGKYKQLISKVFANDQLFTTSLDMACASVVNFRIHQRQPCKSPELLAKYCDSLLKKSTRGGTEQEIEDKLAQCITVFKYIDDKDVFQKFYSRNLAKRLIHQLSHSMDLEEAMINRLKQACGYEFTSKLHRMFTDISVSADLNNKFSAVLKKDNVELGLNFSIYVLQAGAWPMGQTCPTEFALPQELEKSVQMFEDFYKKSFNGRKLAWLHHLSQGDLKLNYLKRPYVITMQTFQMAILLLFESVNTLTCRELEEATKLSSDQFHKNMQSLVECKLVTASAPGESMFQPETVFTLNLDYNNKRTKFRITAAAQRENVQETEQTHASIDEDRKLYLQATIVRIMKSRKVLRHNSLIQEVLSQSKARFAPSVHLIKKCVETLIDKQYLERTPNSTDEYSYVA